MERRLACVARHLLLAPQRRAGSGSGSDSAGPLWVSFAAADPSQDELYAILGLDPSASESDIRKAYRRAAVKFHPDKGGDEGDFQKISRAYEVLSDEEKKSIYDQVGLEGLEQHEQGEAAGGAAGGMDGMDPFSMFEGLFGGGGMGGGMGGARGGRRRSAGPREQQFELSCTLNEAYTGKQYRVQFDRNAPCATCTGTGVAEGHDRESASVVCERCGGAGQQIRAQRTMFGMQRVQVTCEACAGSGRVLDPALLCPTCEGGGLQRERCEYSPHFPAPPRGFLSG